MDFDQDAQFKNIIAAAKAEARRAALEEAAELRFILRLPTPETGPFTIQQMAVDDYSAAIKAMI